MPFRIDINAMIMATLQNEPLHGYEIVRRIKETGGAGKLSEGQIYPYLHELESKGLLSSCWQTDTGAAARKVYQLTAAGHKELEKHRAEWDKFVSGVSSVFMSGIANVEAGNA